jgi:hypothetical protein
MRVVAHRGPRDPARVWTTAAGDLIEASRQAQTLLNWRYEPTRLTMTGFFADNAGAVQRALAAAANGNASTLAVTLHPYNRVPIAVELTIAPTPATDELCWTFTRLRPGDESSSR